MGHIKIKNIDKNKTKIVYFSRIYDTKNKRSIEKLLNRTNLFNVCFDVNYQAPAKELIYIGLWPVRLFIGWSVCQQKF
jgi:hypothetical protein